jgi:hypothetical protein
MRLALLAIGILALGVALGAPGRGSAGAPGCVDPAPGGGAMGFNWIGTPNHNATRQGELCPAAEDVWEFLTAGAPQEEFLGVFVTLKSGLVSFAVEEPGGALVPIELGREYRARVEGGSMPYRVHVRGEGDGLSAYRVHVCRSVPEPCVYNDDVTPKPGDTSCDGQVDSRDAALILQFVAGLIIEVLCPSAADILPDTGVNARDALLILQFDAGLIDSLFYP